MSRRCSPRARLRLTGAHRERRCGRCRASSRSSCRPRCTGVRWTTLVIAVGFIAVGVARRARGSSGDPGARRHARRRRRSSSSTPRTTSPTTTARTRPPSFAGTVWTNNAWIAAQCVLFGVTGIWPLMVLVQNAIGVGTAAAVMIAFGRGDVFVLYILPHGLLELTCIFVAAAAGLHIFWAWVAPGARTRGRGARRRGPLAGHRRDRPGVRARALGHRRGLRHARSPGRGRSRSASARSRSRCSCSTCWSSGGARTGGVRPAT